MADSKENYLLDLGSERVNLTLTVNVNVLPSLNSFQAASTLKFNISIYCVLFS